MRDDELEINTDAIVACTDARFNARDVAVFKIPRGESGEDTASRASTRGDAATSGGAGTEDDASVTDIVSAGATSGAAEDITRPDSEMTDE